MSITFEKKASYTFAEMQEITSSIIAAIKSTATPESLDSILNEITKLTENITSFSEEAKSDILEFAEGIIRYERHPQHQRGFAQRISEIVNKEEIKIWRNKTSINFSEKQNIPQLQKAVIKLCQKLSR